MTVQVCTARAAATPGTRDDTGAVRPRASTGARSDGGRRRRCRGGSSDDPDASDADASDGLSGDDDDARRDRWEAKRRRLEMDRSRRHTDARSGRDLEHHGEKETSDDAFFDPATEGTPGPPCVLRLEYWMRSEACTERKRRHVEAIDARGGYWGMEEHIERTVFGGCDAADDDDTSSAGTITPETKPSKKKKARRRARAQHVSVRVSARCDALDAVEPTRDVTGADRPLDENVAARTQTERHEVEL